MSTTAQPPRDRTPADLPCGVDFGGSGIKAAPVDLETGAFAADRVRIPTPQPSTPDAVARVLVELLGRFPDTEGPVGVTVPGVVRHGVVRSANTSTGPGSAPTRTRSSPGPPVARCTSSTTRTPRASRRSGTARHAAAEASCW